MVARSRKIMTLISIRANSGFLRSAVSNSLSSSAMTRQALFATAGALRGASEMIAISPKILWRRMSGIARSFSEKMFSPSAMVAGLSAARKDSSASAGS